MLIKRRNADWKCSDLPISVTVPQCITRWNSIPIRSGVRESLRSIWTVAAARPFCNEGKICITFACVGPLTDDDGNFAWICYYSLIMGEIGDIAWFSRKKCFGMIWGAWFSVAFCCSVAWTRYRIILRAPKVLRPREARLGDISKAFDKVWHDALSDKLPSFGL